MAEATCKANKCKVATNVDDATCGFLNEKIISNDNSIVITVYDAGAGVKKLNLMGGTGIQSLTTIQRLALVPITALIVQDIDLDMYFKWSTVTSSWNPF